MFSVITSRVTAYLLLIVILPTAAEAGKWRRCLPTPPCPPRCCNNCCDSCTSDSPQAPPVQRSPVQQSPVMVQRMVFQPETVMVPTTTMVPQTILRPRTVLTRADGLTASNFISPVAGAGLVSNNIAQLPNQPQGSRVQQSVSSNDSNGVEQRLRDLEERVNAIERKLRRLCEE